MNDNVGDPGGGEREQSSLPASRGWPTTVRNSFVFVLTGRGSSDGARFDVELIHGDGTGGTRGLGACHSGAVIVVQRFGGALNLNVHLHALVLDGVFARADDGRLRFHRAPAPMPADVADVLAAIVPGARARLARWGLDDDGETGEDRLVDTEPALAGLAAASVQGVLALAGRVRSRDSARPVGRVRSACGGGGPGPTGAARAPPLIGADESW